jgi:RNA:NAD 2'-phosphotransferase (TPT1/KptA family)
MFNDGIEFVQAENGAWLTDTVPSEYLDIVQAIAAAKIRLI